MKKSSSARRGPSPGLGSDAGAEALLESRPGPGLPPSDALPRYFCTATAAQVQNRLDLPNAEGTGLFRAHEVRGITPISKVTARAYERERVVRVSEAPFRRSVKTVGLGQPASGEAYRSCSRPGHVHAAPGALGSGPCLSLSSFLCFVYIRRLKSSLKFAQYACKSPLLAIEDVPFVSFSLMLLQCVLGVPLHAMKPGTLGAIVAAVAAALYGGSASHHKLKAARQRGFGLSDFLLWQLSYPLLL